MWQMRQATLTSVENQVHLAMVPVTANLKYYLEFLVCVRSRFSHYLTFKKQQKQHEKKMDRSEFRSAGI